MVLSIVSMWKLFVRAGEPGWAILIPIFNLYTLWKTTGKPILWLILCFVPLINLVAIILIMISFAKSFGKSTGYGVGLAFLAPIFAPMLAFSDAKYIGPQG